MKWTAARWEVRGGFCVGEEKGRAAVGRWRSLAEGKERGIPVFYCNFYAKKIRGIRQEMTGFEIWDFMGIKRAGGLFFLWLREGESVCWDF